MIEIAVAAHAELGAGPTWDPVARRLIWVDVLTARVHLSDPATGRQTVLDTGQHVGAAKPREGGGLVVNLRDGVGLYDASGGFSWLAEDAVPGRRGNGAAVAPDGALWAGTVRDDEEKGGGALTRVAPDGTAETVVPDATAAGGTGWSPDGSLMYWTDSPTRRIDVFTVTDDGRVRDRRPFVDTADLTGSPDGMTVDAEGCVWAAFRNGGAVHRFTPDGALDLTVEVPVSRPTACAFGGTDLTDLYITTARTGLAPGAEPAAGSVLVLPGAGQGLPQPAFRG
ncbi:SMP-30/gluconolactonase/LRE family protein [Streptomyces avicenniae]|uniref:SMP-30/gluconolactonase/LRE family protein n=1 Tax=Streptomyces avicenniae TaxID=500153 RepID=UPI00069B4140|nr:SMP-30/gluconolactonase/LRE family protein [Streptomyces avicenniae]